MTILLCFLFLFYPAHDPDRSYNQPYQKNRPDTQHQHLLGQRYLRFDLQLFRHLYRFLIRDAGTANQKAVCIDGIRGTGNHSHLVGPLCNRKSLGLCWKNRQYLIHLIGQGPVQHLDIKYISIFNLVQIRE